MPIHTEAPDKDTYVRIIAADKSGGKGDTPYVGKVGIVMSTGETPSVGQNNIKLIFVDVHGESSALVFNEDNIEYITGKEYFMGALGG